VLFLVILALIDVALLCCCIGGFGGLGEVGRHRGGSGG
jgi:hypothetical protein